MENLPGRLGPMGAIPETLAILRPEELFPLWYLVDSLERSVEMAVEDAVCWKHGIFGLMERWGLEANDLTTSDSR